MSPKKPRKTLDDSLATEFVYGVPSAAMSQEETAPVAEAIPELEEEPVNITPPPEQAKPKPPKTSKPKSTGAKTSLMSKLMETPEKEATVRLTVDLPESMHRKLSILCVKAGKKKADIIRMLLDEALEDIDD